MSKENSNEFQEKFDSGFAVIPNELLKLKREGEIDWIEFMILHLILAYRNIREHHTSKSKIAELIGERRTTVAEALNKLEEKKFITIRQIDSWYIKIDCLIEIGMTFKKSNSVQFTIGAIDDGGAQNCAGDAQKCSPPDQNCSGGPPKIEHPPCSKLSNIEVNTLEEKYRSKNIEVNSECSEQTKVCSSTPPTLKVIPELDFKEEQVETLLVKVSTATQRSILKLYDDNEFLRREFIKMATWVRENAKKAPKSNYTRFIMSWLERGWESYRKGIPSKNISNAQARANRMMNMRNPYEKDNNVINAQCLNTKGLL
jgi:hypothetical protein